MVLLEALEILLMDILKGTERWLIGFIGTFNRRQILARKKISLTKFNK